MYFAVSPIRTMSLAMPMHNAETVINARVSMEKSAMEISPLYAWYEIYPKIATRCRKSNTQLRK